MRKTAVLTLSACMLNIFAVIPANAAFLENKLAEAIAMDPKAARIQELLKIKQNIGPVNRQAVVETLLRAAIERTVSGNKAVSATDNAGQAAEVSAGQQAVAQVNVEEELYYKEMSVLAILFNLNGQLKPQAVIQNNSLSGAPDSYHKLIQMIATAYVPGSAGNGKWGKRIHLGTYVSPGVAAVDPSIIPLGTRLWVEGYGEAVAADTGNAIKGNRIDLAFNNRQDALKYGIKRVNVYIME